MGTVVTYAADQGLTDHEVAGRVAVAKSLAALKGFDFGGGYDPALQHDLPLYFVPSETLSRQDAARLGIRGADDLFGGVVPYPFVATKTIAHPLAGRDARRPEGWSEAFPQRVHAVVLPGFAAFTRADALKAAQRLLEDGPVRLKHGRWHCGVLEQSWRIGGASGPEVAALEAFRADPRLRALRACSTEAYGAEVKVPRGSRIHFQGEDPQAGPLVKYTVVEPHETAH